MRVLVARTPLAVREPRLQGQEVLVIGLGRSGRAAMRLAAAKGARVTVTDARPEAELGAAAEEARALGATVRAGGNPPELALGADLLVVSPGVPLTIPLVEAARRRDIPVWGEVELAWRYCRGRVLGITGSNGKSTVTSMSGAILGAAGIPGGVGGNLGTPLSDLLVEDRPCAVHAVELSSFQLEAVEMFRPEGAVVVNLSPDHLDRYSGFEEYVRAKARLLEAQDLEGFAVLNADDRESARLRDAARARLHLFSLSEPQERGAWIRDGQLALNTDAGVETIMAAGEVPVRGEHNLANALAAALACRLMGASPAAIAEGLRAYRPLPHRLQHVATHDGVAYFDDSKATNPDAALRALRSFPPASVLVILGGKDKGAPWKTLVPTLEKYARSVLLVGEAADGIRRALGDRIATVDCETIPEAVRTAAGLAREGDVVLLAPGCASFDQYRSFEERGDDFQRAVRDLTGEGDGLA